MVEEIFALLNEQRNMVGAAALEYRPDLTSASNLRAEESSKKWSHERPNSKPFYSVDKRIYGENLARGYNNSADEFVTAWMKSETHKKNILYPDFKGVCVGVYEKNGKLWVSLEFTYE